MNYIQAMDKINGRLRFGIKPGLERIEELLERLGNPHKKLKYVHVAGTNGKGSCCALVSSALTEAGYKTGLYTSPFVLDFRERFRIDGEMIEESQLIIATETVSKVADEMEAQGETITEFEFITALAFYWFHKCSCDIVVLEVGLGGRFDATNIIDTTEVSVIMSIALDHTAVLGDTLPEIAFEKAGIIKQGGNTVMYPLQNPEVIDVIADVCKKRDNNLYMPDTGEISLQKSSIKGSEFTVSGRPLVTPFMGEHQIYNAATAYRALMVLKDKGFKISNNDIAMGFKNANIPARMQILSEVPLVFMDGGHNPQCGEALAKVLKKYADNKNITAVIGMMKDKDVDTYMKQIAPLCKTVITVEPEGERAMKNEELAEIAERYCSTVKIAESDKAAADMAFENIDDNSAVVVCGSFFIIRGLKAEIDKKL